MISVLLVSFCLLFATVSSAKYQPTWDSLDTRPLPQWYDQVKFGIFMHWGVYSVPSFGPGFSAEWFWYRWQNKEPGYAEFIEKNYPPGFTYPDFAPMFKAEMFDPVKWANLFKQSGAKYVVLTSKHHEGFTNWPSKTAWNWNAVDTGPHMDLVGSLADAIRNTTDIHFGLYFSQFEWFNPLYLQDAANNYKTSSYPQQVSIPQMYEIVNAYKPEVIWSDGSRGPSSYWNSTEFLAWLYNESPVKDTIVVNDRWGSDCTCKHGGFFTCHDRYNPHSLQKYKWENAFTVDSHSWGYRRNANTSEILSIEDILEEIVSTVSCGGNALMNVGPTHDGRIIPIFEERLLQIGAWLKTNGEAIYNTIPWKHQNDSVNGDVWYTLGNGDDSKGNVYAISLKWPDNNQLNLGSVKLTSTSKATLLGYGSVQVKGSIDGQTQIMMPGLSLDTQLLWAWVIKLEGVTPN